MPGKEQTNTAHKIVGNVADQLQDAKESSQKLVKTASKAAPMITIPAGASYSTARLSLFLAGTMLLIILSGLMPPGDIKKALEKWMAKRNDSLAKPITSGIEYAYDSTVTKGWFARLLRPWEILDDKAPEKEHHKAAAASDPVGLERVKQTTGEATATEDDPNSTNLWNRQDVGLLGNDAPRNELNAPFSASPLEESKGLGHG